MTESGPLEEQLTFLLDSLDDLERERAAGDVDEHDYAALKDDYTARAAAAARSIEAGHTRPPRSPSVPWTRRLGAGAAVLLFAVVAGVLVAQAVGRRDPGEVLTGGINQSVTEKLNVAGRRGATGDLTGAIEVYDEVLARDPTNAEALSYKGWMLTLSGEAEAGLTALIDAATAHPTYPDVHAFLAVVFLRSGLTEQASRELDRLDALDPPPAIVELTANLRTQVRAALDSTTTTPDADQTGGGR